MLRVLPPRRAGPAPYGAGTLSTRAATPTFQCLPVPLWRMHPTGRGAPLPPARIHSPLRRE